MEYLGRKNIFPPPPPLRYVPLLAGENGLHLKIHGPCLCGILFDGSINWRPRGRHTASRLAEAGATVLVHGRREASVRDAVEFVKSKGSGVSKVEGFVADVSSLRGMNLLCDEVLARTDRLDCLINNAGRHASSFQGSYAEGLFPAGRPRHWFLGGGVLYVSTTLPMGTNNVPVHPPPPLPLCIQQRCSSRLTKISAHLSSLPSVLFIFLIANTASSAAL